MADMADTPERFRVHESGACTERSLRSDQSYFHGTKADLEAGDHLSPGYRSNYRPEHISNYVYMTKVLDGAVLAAEMAVGEGNPRVYIVQPTGNVEDDPNVTDKKYPGNPTHSFRSAEPVRIVAEMMDWVGHSPECLQHFRDGLEALRRTGSAILYD